MSENAAKCIVVCVMLIGSFASLSFLAFQHNQLEMKKLELQKVKDIKSLLERPKQ